MSETEHQESQNDTFVTATTKQHLCFHTNKAQLHLALIAAVPTCGSIISGQRLPLVTRMPLSTDTPSLGSPAITQSRTSTGLARVPRRVQDGETGICSSWHFETQPATSSSLQQQTALAVLLLL
jgi:hypothetical protein